MKISLLHPSRSRPQKAFDTAKEWMDKSGNVKLEYIQSLDWDDPKIDQYKALSNVFFPDKVPGIIGTNHSVVEATNRAAKSSTGDILLYLSDDFKCPDNWGPLVIKEFENENRPLLVKVDDCLQKFEVPVLTIPMMNRALYEKLGYFFHPDYKSMFCDEQLFWVTRRIGALKLAEHLKFPHEHVSIGKSQDDDTYRRSAANWEQGKATFARHKAAGFPV